MGNLEEHEFRRREEAILRDEKDELKEIKDDIIQKLKLMKIFGFETLEEFLRSRQTKLAALDSRDLKDLNKQYRRCQYRVLEKLLEFKYFKGELHDLVTPDRGTLLAKRDDPFRYGQLGEGPGLVSDFDEPKWGERRAEFKDDDPRGSNADGKRASYKSEERSKFPTREKRRVLVKVSKYLKKSHTAKVS